MDRKKRTSKKQFQIYVKYLKNCEVLRTGKLNPSDDPKYITNIWDCMTAELNATGDGPKRDTQEWKKVFREWKSAVRKRARENKDLSHLEESFLQLTGTVAVTGLPVAEVCDMKKVEDLGECITDYEVIVEDNEGDNETNTAEENIVIQVDAPTKKSKKKKNDNPLLSAYIEGQESERNGLSEIAKSLDNIAKEKCKKTSAEQYKTYLTILQKYKTHQNIPEEEFEKMCMFMNKYHKGPIKSKEEWHQTFREWTSKTKRKAREIFRYQQQTGGGPPLNSFLNELENWLMNILDMLVIVGMNICELGLHKEKKIKPTVLTGKVYRRKQKRKRITKTTKRILCLFKNQNKMKCDTNLLLLSSINNVMFALIRFFSIINYKV